nr:hypothetical protein [Bacteroidota bacterium]
MRDSGGYSVDQYGNILNQNFTIGDTISVSYDSTLYFTNYHYFAQPPAVYTTPAGSFNNLKMIANKIEFDSLPYSPFSPLIFNQIEANGVGEIFNEITYTSFIPLKKKYERRLIRYQLL